MYKLQENQMMKMRAFVEDSWYDWLVNHLKSSRWGQGQKTKTTEDCCNSAS